MFNLIEPGKPLPQFRADLQLFRGPDDLDGSPTYNLLDPVKVKYYKISWAESLVLQYLRPGMTIEDVVEAVNSHSTINITPEDIQPFFEDAMRFGLINFPRSSESLEQEAQLAKVNPISWLLQHYLYFRIPLINPDKFLGRTLKYVRFLGSPPAFIVYAVLLLIGIVLLINRFEEFINTFTYFFSLEGILIYGIGISAIKLVHEFSHAYTAKRYGLHVPTMGIALLVLWPVLYTDVTDGWKLKDRKQRLAVSAAGVISELIIAGLATIGWSITPPGPLQSLFFVAASITWLSSVFININPAMRFDGYYIACDLYGMDNLQPRAFAITRWKFRDWFLGLKMPPPEEFSSKAVTYLVLYTIYTWTYRLFLYIGIAIFVYHTFTKALGIFLFIVEILLFICWPLLWEFQALHALRDKLTLNPRMTATLICTALLLTWFILPLPHELRFPAIVIPVKSQFVRSTEPGVVEKIMVKRGDFVKKGETLVTIVSKDVNSKIKELGIDKKLLEHTILIYGINEGDRPFIAEKQAELASTEAQILGWKNRADSLIIRAENDGYVYSWDQDLKEGTTVSQDQLFGKIAEKDARRLVFFVPETDMEAHMEGKKVRFIVNSDFRTFKALVTKANLVSTDNLIYPALSSEYKGELAVSNEQSRLKQGRLVLVDTYYEVYADLKDTDSTLQIGQTGYVLVDGPWRSKLMRLVRFVTSTLLKESSI